MCEGRCGTHRSHKKTNAKKVAKGVDKRKSCAIMATSIETTQGKHKMIKGNLYNAPKALHQDGKRMMLELTTGERFIVKGSREANKICKEHNAKPWNF